MPIRKDPDEGDGNGTPGDRPAAAGTAFWRKPVFWLGGVVVSALAVAISNWLVPHFTDVLQDASATGEPLLVNDVSVHVRGSSNWPGEPRGLEPNMRDYLPPGAGFTPTDLRELDVKALSGTENPSSWLEQEFGAMPPGPMDITIVLSGNRPDPVRIIDIKPKSECVDASEGTLFVNGSAGGVDETVRLTLQVDAPDPVGMYYHHAGEPEPWFPGRTISLAKGEQQVLVVMAWAEDSLCSFDLEFTVVHQQSRHTQTISDKGRQFTVVGADPAKIEDTYLGGTFCRTYVKASEEWRRGTSVDPGCGPGNEFVLP